MGRPGRNRFIKENFAQIALPEQQRKRPCQARSIALVEALKQSARTLLESEGRAALTLQCLSERSGVAISSIYEYFPTMDALVSAILDDYRDLMLVEVTAELRALPAATSLYEAISTMIRVFFELRRKQLQIDAALSTKSIRYSELLRLDVVGSDRPPQLELILELIERYPKEITIADPEKVLFFVDHTVKALPRAIALERPGYLSEPDTVDLLARMLYALLNGPDRRSAIAH